MSKPIDYDWRTRTEHERIFSEQCAIAVREAAIHVINETEDERKKQAERIGSFFADALNALYLGFSQYPEKVNGFPRCGLCSTPLEDSQQLEDKERQA